MIIRGGENIYPKEIEDVLARHPAVSEAAVIGSPDTKWGEIVFAYVVARAGSVLDRDALDTWCVAQLSPYKRPVDLVFSEALPLNAVGKVDKATLRQQYSK